MSVECRCEKFPRASKIQRRDLPEENHAYLAPTYLPSYLLPLSRVISPASRRARKRARVKRVRRTVLAVYTKVGDTLSRARARVGWSARGCKVKRVDKDVLSRARIMVRDSTCELTKGEEETEGRRERRGRCRQGKRRKDGERVRERETVVVCRGLAIPFPSSTSLFSREGGRRGSGGGETMRRMCN